LGPDLHRPDRSPPLPGRRLPRGRRHPIRPLGGRPAPAAGHEPRHRRLGAVMSEIANFTVDTEARIVRGRLLPYGELSRRSVTTEPVMFAKGTVELPADPSVITLNREHSQHYPIGRAIEVSEADGGIDVAFQIARTPDGDQAL